MGKDTDQSDDDDLTLFEHDEELDADNVMELIDETPPTMAERNLQQKQRAKKRMDAYLERQWFKENGWDEEDDLFKDEFFNDTG